MIPWPLTFITEEKTTDSSEHRQSDEVTKAGSYGRGHVIRVYTNSPGANNHSHHHQTWEDMDTGIRRQILLLYYQTCVYLSPTQWKGSDEGCGDAAGTQNSSFCNIHSPSDQTSKTNCCYRRQETYNCGLHLRTEDSGPLDVLYSNM